MNNKQARFVWVPLLVAVAVVGGILIGRFFSSEIPFGNSARYDKIESLLQCIEQQYVDTVNRADLIENVMPKILGELDPHSAYIPAKDLESVNEELEGSFSGIGIQFNILNDTINVVSVIPGGPSEKVGILAGDRIVAVDDSAYVGKEITNEGVMKHLKGPKGSTVKLEILRKTSKKPLTYEVTRGDIPVNSVDAAFMLDDRSGYIKVSKFGRTTYDEFINALSKLNNEGAQNFIIDLRGNSGGLMDTPINMANELLPANRLIVYAEGKAFEREDAISNGTGTFQEAPLIILTDEWSASSSEIFAGSIQDNDRGLIVGRRTFGKGLVQQQIPFRDGSAIRLTVARYYTPSGRCIQKEYQLGKADDYSMDIVNRYIHGEFFNVDSIKQNKDLVFHTVNGREVYGGGGIMPDVFVPRDTTGVTSYFNNVANEGLLYQYSFDYTDKNRERLAKAKTVEELLPMLDANTLLNSFVQYAAQKGIRPRPVYINISRKLIVNTLQAYIARNMLGEEAFYKLLLRDDETLRKAQEILNEGNQYQELLSSPTEPQEKQ